MLRGVGIDESRERVYLELLRTRTSTAAELGLALSLAEADIQKYLSDLRDLGLVTIDDEDGSRHTAVPPDIGLGTLIVERQAQLQQARTTVDELQRVYREGPASAGQVELLTTVDQLSQWLENIERATRSEILVFFRLPYNIEVDLENAALPRPVRYRYVYERSALDHPRVPDEIDAFLRSGAQVRVAPSVPSKLIIADGSVAVMPVLPNQQGISPGFLLIRSPAVVQSLTQLFELTWEFATPLRISPTGLADDDVPALDEFDATLLTLMLSGLPDKAVAARLGTSERTVQRHLQQLMRLTGTTSRMHLGWHAAKTGMIPD